MKTGTYKFNRLELAGSLGDLGTLLPLSIAMIIILKLSVTTVFFMMGLFYIFSGLYFRLPIPVQPLKVVSAIAIAYPSQVSLSVLAASGIIFGFIMLFLSFSGLIDRIAKFFTKPVIRGIQLGLGFILINRAVEYITEPGLISGQPHAVTTIFGLSLNPIIGIAGSFITLLLLSSKRFPAALVMVVTGVIIGILSGSLANINIVFGPTPVDIYFPAFDDFMTAAVVLVIPQVPLTLGNAVMGTTDTCYSLFGSGEITKNVSNRAFSISMGLANIITGFVGGIPMCHGSGGLAAHYRFGARTGGSNIMIGLIFLIIAIVLGSAGVTLLSSIPNAVLGILLLFAGLELAVLIRDIQKKNDLFISLLIAGIGFATTNMAIAFIIGISAMFLIRWKNLSL